MQFITTWYFESFHVFRKSINHTFSGFNGPEMTTTEESSIGSGDSNYGQRNLITMEDELSGEIEFWK